MKKDEELARQLVELGYRGSGEVLKREEFEARKLAAEASKQSKKNQQQWVNFWTLLELFFFLSLLWFIEFYRVPEKTWMIVYWSSWLNEKKPIVQEKWL